MLTVPVFRFRNDQGNIRFWLEELDNYWCIHRSMQWVRNYHEVMYTLCMLPVAPPNPSSTSWRVLNTSSNLWWWIRKQFLPAWSFLLGVCTEEFTSCGSNFRDNRSFTIATNFSMLRYDWPGIRWVNSSHPTRCCSIDPQLNCWVNCAKMRALHSKILHWSESYIIHLPWESSIQRLGSSEYWMSTFIDFSTMTSAAIFHFPSGLQSCVPFHVSSSPGPRNDKLKPSCATSGPFRNSQSIL